MRFSYVTTFWLVAGLAIAIGQGLRQVWPGPIVFNSALAFDIALPLWLILLVSLLFIWLMIWLFYSHSTAGSGWAVALGCIVGGGTSNLLDRLFLHGNVADYWQLFHLGTINFSDLMITIGIVLAIWYLQQPHAT